MRFLNQICAKVGVEAPHIKFTVVVSRSKRDHVTKFQVENTGCVRGKFVAFSRVRRLDHGHGFAVDISIDSSRAVIVDLQVDKVPSSGRHSEFSIMVLHPSSKMAVRGSNRPVFDHYRVKRKLMLILGDFH